MEKTYEITQGSKGIQRVQASPIRAILDLSLIHISWMETFPFTVIFPVAETTASEIERSVRSPLAR